MKNIYKRLMAYIYMPLIFAIIGYFIIYIMSIPFQETGRALAKLVISDNVPNFDSKLGSIFEPSEPIVESPLPANDTVTTEDATSTNDVMPKSDTVAISEIVIPEYEIHYAEITCDRIGLSADLYFGDSNEVLRYGIGQYSGGFFPGFGGTILLAGHNNTYFLPLKDIKAGDVIQITTNYGVYKYQVKETKILRHNDDSAFDLSQTKKEQLVAYTCYPFEEISGIRQERLFVYADKVSGPDVVDEN